MNGCFIVSNKELSMCEARIVCYGKGMTLGQDSCTASHHTGWFIFLKVKTQVFECTRPTISTNEDAVMYRFRFGLSHVETSTCHECVLVSFVC